MDFKNLSPQKKGDVEFSAVELEMLAVAQRSNDRLQFVGAYAVVAADTIARRMDPFSLRGAAAIGKGLAESARFDRYESAVFDVMYNSTLGTLSRNQPSEVTA